MNLSTTIEDLVRHVAKDGATAVTLQVQDSRTSQAPNVMARWSLPRGDGEALIVIALGKLHSDEPAPIDPPAATDEHVPLPEVALTLHERVAIEQMRKQTEVTGLQVEGAAVSWGGSGDTVETPRGRVPVQEPHPDMKGA